MMPTAQAVNLARCLVCGMVSRMPNAPAAACTRCGAELTFRKRRSIERTWAYLIAAYILYIPANVLPIMHTESLIHQRNDTILSGIIFLWTVNNYLLATVVFVASIMVPLVKLITLTTLVMSVKSPSRFSRMARTKAYRVVETIGRWSMLDVYVAALLTSLVHQSAATIVVGPAAFPFTAVVILTLLASRSFDARLMWDSREEEIYETETARMRIDKKNIAHG
jgi:paraquat-inducible protein A